MQIINERPSTDIIMEVDFTDDEFELLLNFAKTHMPEDELNKCYVEWAIVDAIKRLVNEHEKKAETDE